MFEKAGKGAFELLDKLTELPYFLFLLSLAVFSDTYLLAIYGTTIHEISNLWLNQHASLNDILSYLGCIGFFYAALVPGLRFFVELLTIFIPNQNIPSSKDGWVRLNHLAEYAITNNNSLAYKEYEKALDKVRNERHQSGLCLSLVVLTAIGFLLSTETHQGIFNFIYFGVKAFPWYASWPLTIAIIPFLLFVVLFAVRAGSRYDDYVFLPKFNEWPRKP